MHFRWYKLANKQHFNKYRYNIVQKSNSQDILYPQSKKKNPLNFPSMKSPQVIDSDQVPTQRMNTVTKLSGTKQSKGLEGFPGIISPVGVCC